MTRPQRSKYYLLVLSAFCTLQAGTATGISTPIGTLLIGTNTDISDDLTTQRRDPAIAYNSTNNEFFVTWFDSRRPGENDIFAQRLTAEAERIGPNLPIALIPRSQSNPDVAYNSEDNQYLVAWQTQEPGSFNKGRGRIVDHDGGLSTPDFAISNGGLESSLAYNPTDNEFFYQGRGSGILGAIVPASGPPVTKTIRITNSGAPAPSGSVAHNLNTNQYLTTWRDQVNSDLRARLYDADGTPLGDPFIVSDVFPSSGQPADIEYDPFNNRYLIIFGRFSGGPIYGQFVSDAGKLIDDRFIISPHHPNERSPSLIFDPANHAFLAAWYQGRDVFAQLLLDDGTLINDPVKITDRSSLLNTGAPALAYNSSNAQVLIAWADNRNLSSGQQDIYAQRLQIFGSTAVPEPLTATLGSFCLIAISLCSNRRH